MSNPILLAQIGAPHGVRGEVRVKSFTDDPLALSDYGPLFSHNGTTFEITSLRPAKTMLVVKFSSINNREMAEKLNRTELFVDRSNLPDDTGEDEFYVSDLIGMDVLDDAGVLVGTIVDVPNFGAGDLLEIAPVKKNGGFSDRTYYLAFTKDNVPEVDFDRKLVKVKPPLEVSEREGEGDER